MKLVRLCMLVSIGLGIALGAVLAIARAPGPRPIALLAENSCPLPCWHGITPDVTTIYDALRILTSDPAIDIKTLSVASNMFVEFTVRTSQGPIESRLFFKGKLVTHTFFYMVSSQADHRIADVIAWLGVPKQVIYSGRNSITISYNTLGVHAVMSAQPGTSAPLCNRIQSPMFAIGLGSLRNLPEGNEWQGFDWRFNNFCRHRF